MKYSRFFDGVGWMVCCYTTWRRQIIPFCQCVSNKIGWIINDIIMDIYEIIWFYLVKSLFTSKRSHRKNDTSWPYFSSPPRHNRYLAGNFNRRVKWRSSTFARNGELFSFKLRWMDESESDDADLSKSPRKLAKISWEFLAMSSDDFCARAAYKKKERSPTHTSTSRPDTPLKWKVTSLLLFGI